MEDQIFSDEDSQSRTDSQLSAKTQQEKGYEVPQIKKSLQITTKTFFCIL